MKTVQAIISDDEIDRVHANANFSSMSKREVVAEGVVTGAFGYACGHTMECILREHGLIRKQRYFGDPLKLTKKGLEYLRATGAYEEAMERIKGGGS